MCNAESVHSTVLMSKVRNITSLINCECVCICAVFIKKTEQEHIILDIELWYWEML